MFTILLGLRGRILSLCFLIVSVACQSNTESLFELLPASRTGVDFENRLAETPQMNIFSYLYFYNGGGVAAGDLNGDSLPDLYFTSNLESNKLYLNQADFTFQDITEATNVGGNSGWTTGVTMADVNGDGRLDIYVSQLGDYQNIRGRNQLYINQGNDAEGIPTFVDQAADYGLDLIGFSTQAAFFDYDLDGDLDMYMLNHSTHANGTFGRATLRKEKHPLAGDKLMRNDGNTFTDVTDSSGIYSSVLGYGLGITVGDVNWDGYPDVYVGNDFHENDYLYINNGDGTFSEKLEEMIQHTGRFSMGNDIADINNDGLPDILSLDMLPSDPVMLKMSAGEDAYDVYNYKLQYGYNHQFARNTLQLNRGNNRFSEIGLLAEVYATDWSWSGLIADLDLDGYKDLYIANGIKRRSNDLDYIKYVSNDAVQQQLEGDLTSEDLALIEQLPIIKIPNVAFKNQRNLHFNNASEDWGLSQASFSNGAAYADLDNDGDLDLVVNNIDQPAFIYRNRAGENEQRTNNYLKIKLEGEGANPFGIGTKVIIPTDSQTIIHEVYTTRGYQSAVPAELIIGLGERQQVDSLIIVWPDHRFELLQNVKVNQTVTAQQKNASGTYNFSSPHSPLFSEVDSLVDYVHQENLFIEFNREALIPHMSSTEGPKLAVGDVNGDRKEDFFVGGAKRQAGAVFVQTSSGFSQLDQPAFRADSVAEDIGAELVDTDNDGDLDLVVASGGNEFQGEAEPLMVRLYQNDGRGNFTRNLAAIPNVSVNASCVRAADFDSDGDQDLFIGGRVVAWNYGKVPTSYLLQNDGQGNFSIQTDEIAEGLSSVGMVKDARWADVNTDGALDLIVVGEWMPITVFLNQENKQLVKADISSLGNTNGWWNTVEATDIDGDGDLDILAGNLGLNSKLKASPEKPVSLAVKDIDDNGTIEQLLFHYVGDEKRLFATKDEITSQLVDVKNRFTSYIDFAQANVNEIFPSDVLSDAEQYSAYELRSGAFINDGNQNFQFQPFPVPAQFAPINAIYLTDVNNDSKLDILTAGNFYEVTIERGRYDASYSTLLKNGGEGNFTFIPNTESGLYLNGQVRNIAEIMYQGDKTIIVARNKQTLLFLKKNENTHHTLSSAAN
ncbi:VCBS repeat-containing protein [Tunicatimonas pelagia]|uniref:VCBS repeat-containing protein n=1 Tax=Tunicatimonas pelagia TaxID=931531 RepID=UPI0026655475|nr:VCBS repeat-containing protein [Tunicatimonas pelagia]WKN40784.1 VCBS repeat-containing protein [Tunicatimonas pelagia]